MDRRSFLETGLCGVLAAGVSVATARVGSAAETVGAGSARAGFVAAASSRVSERRPGSKLRLSLAAYSFRELLSGETPKMTLEEFIDLCADLGIEGTELTSYYFRRTDPEYLISLRRRAYVNGLTISGSPIGCDFCPAPGPERVQQLEHAKAWIDRVAILGSQTIRVFAGSVPRGDDEKAAVARAIEGLKEIAEYAGRKGVILGLENHGGITSTADQILALVEGVSSPWLGINLDTGNFHKDVWASLERIAPHAVAVQVKTEIKEEGRAAVETDYPRLVELLVRAGYRGFVALEFEGKGDPRDEVPKHLKLMGSAIAAAKAS
jgi:sugar phosphate isomerase/epimerase